MAKGAVFDPGSAQCPQTKSGRNIGLYGWIVTVLVMLMLSVAAKTSIDLTKEYRDHGVEKSVTVERDPSAQNSAWVLEYPTAGGTERVPARDLPSNLAPGDRVDLTFLGDDGKFVFGRVTDQSVKNSISLWVMGIIGAFFAGMLATYVCKTQVRDQYEALRHFDAAPAVIETWEKNINSSDQYRPISVTWRYLRPNGTVGHFFGEKMASYTEDVTGYGDILMIPPDNKGVPIFYSKCGMAQIIDGDVVPPLA